LARAGGLMHRMRMLVLAGLLVSCVEASTMVGGAAPAPDATGQSVVVIVGSRGNSCTGVALARDLVLTVAHCVLPGSDYKIVEFNSARQPQLRDVVSVTAHPRFDLKTMLAHRATADVALLKLRVPLASVTPATLGAGGITVAPGDAFTVVGTGVTIRGDGKSGGTARTAALAATGKPGTLQIRLFDPATRGETAGLGACTGDSGAPVFRIAPNPIIIGIVSWSTGPGNTAGCGGLTGVTPLTLYLEWIRGTAKILGNQL
jgi:hypothetical protein